MGTSLRKLGFTVIDFRKSFATHSRIVQADRTSTVTGLLVARANKGDYIFA
jgi:hypothetical protein